MLQLKDIQQIQKDIPPKKFLETLSFVFPTKTTVGLLVRELWFRREEQNPEFPKTFFGGYVFAFVEYLCNCSLKINTKNIKNYRSILAIINHCNTLDDSQPLKTRFFVSAVTSSNKVES